MNSILTSIKKLIGIAEECEDFDDDIIIHINSAFSTLNQIGIGPDEGFVIEDDSKEWSEYSDNLLIIGLVKTYVYLQTKLLFDPPSSGTLMESINRKISEIEWRLNVIYENSKETDGGDQNGE